MSLSASDWNAINWWGRENNYTIRDLMKGPTVVYRDKDNEKVDVNIQFIKDKYKARPRAKKKVES